jgi:surface antigen
MQQINAGSRYEVRQGIACRDPDGVWRTRMETYLDS